MYRVRALIIVYR